MKTKILFFGFYICFTCSFVRSEENFLDLGTGYRCDTLNWNISGGKSGPNILSELKWKHLKSWESFLKLKIALPFKMYFRFYGDYGKIFSGHNKDTDYLGNHRTQPFSLSYSQANRGEVFDFSFGLAKLYTFLRGKLMIAPAFGFSHHEQHLRMIHGDLVLDIFNPDQKGPLDRLHNNYRAQWYGPWIGLDINYPLTCSWELFGGYEYHWSFYRGSGHWNLRTDFLGDFEHAGYARGSFLLLGSYCKFSPSCCLSVLTKYQIMRLRNGCDTTFFLDEFGHSKKAETRLNQVNWQTFSLLFLLAYSF